MLGYHWQMDSRSQEGQESTGQHRDAQGKLHFSFLYPTCFCESNVKRKYKHFQLMTSSASSHIIAIFVCVVYNNYVFKKRARV